MVDPAGQVIGGAPTMVIFEDVTKVYPGNYKAVDNINLKVGKGELVVLIGPSGCGKTTTLKMVNRLIQPSSGKIYLDGFDTDKLDPVELRRQIGYVIQDIALFPHKTVAGNIAVVPRLKKWNREDVTKRVDELLNMVNMEPELFRNRFPNELSGGQQQRIGVLRALAAEPEVMLMDEPFGALDPITRDQLQDELKRLQQKLHKTIIFVTHDMDEALKIADRIVIMKDGHIIQAATPEEILQQPVNDFVRNFIGEERLVRRPEQVTVAEVMLKKPVKMEYYKGLRQGLATMREAGVDSLLITDNDDKFLGVVDVQDIQVNLSKKNKLHEIMREQPTAREDDNVKTVVKLMVDRGIRFVPVVGQEGRLKGIVTRSCVVNFILDYM
jgi:osmoprotectant transport system ATP-binding protein